MELAIESHRGIRTNPNKRSEDKPKTITNRLGQKSIHLPRIDDEKRWAGFPSLAGWARKLAKNIPDCDLFVEVFGGTAKVTQMLLKNTDKKIGQIIINEKSPFLIEWLEKELKTEKVSIERQDFIDCIKKHDSEGTVFLIDPPWFMSYYKQSFSWFDRKSVREYDEQIMSLCTGKPYGEFNKEGYKIKGKFMITSRKENRVMLKTRFNHKLLKSEYVVSGHYPRLLVTNNLKKKR